MNLKRIKSLFDFSFIVRMLKMIWACSAQLLVFRFFLLIFQAILPLIPLYLMKLLLDSFTGTSIPEFDYVLWILIGFAVTELLLIITSNVMSYVTLLQTDIISDHMSEIVISKAIETDLEYFDSDTYHDIFERAVIQSSHRPSAVLNALAQVIQSGVSLFAIFLLLMTLHWGIAIVLILIAIPIAIIRWHYTNKLVDLKVKQTPKERKAMYYKLTLTGSNDAAEVRIFGFGIPLLAHFLKIKKQLRKENRKLYLEQTKSLGLAQSVEAIAIIASLGVIASRALKGLISVGDIAMYFGAFQKGQANITSALKSIVAIHENRKYLEHLFVFLDLERKILDTPSPLEIPNSIETLELKNVSFTYPKTTKEILKDISLTAKKGELVAVVGKNGSGKSTMVKLINRLYDVSEGSVEINGENIKNFTQDDLRSKLTVIFQQYSKYNATVIENIQFADIKKPLDLNNIKLASEKGLALSVIDNLKDGFDTQLGRSFRSGEELSGGEWQKMALSRAFYKDAEIIILDEPTSFIDPLAEDIIFSNLREMAKDKILILITHRIYNLKNADRIIVLDQGEIVESGSHDELMSQTGLYKEMFEVQE